MIYEVNCVFLFYNFLIPTHEKSDHATPGFRPQPMQIHLPLLFSSI